MGRKDLPGRFGFGILAPGLSTAGVAERRSLSAPDPLGEESLFVEVAARIDEGKEQTFPHHVRAGGRKLNLKLDRTLARWRDKGGEAVFELLARALATDKAGPEIARELSGDAEPLTLVVLDRSPVLVESGARLVFLNRAALDAIRLTPSSCLVAVSLVHGIRAAVGLRAGQRRDEEKERTRDLQNLLLLLVGILGTEWEPAEVRERFERLLSSKDPLLAPFVVYAEKLRASLKHRRTRLDDRVYRDGAAFDRLPGRDKLKVVAAGTLAWYGILSIGLLRLPRRFYRGLNPWYETAWWIFRSKPGGRGLVKRGLFKRGVERLKQFRILSGMEYIWSAWNPILAEICLRPVYRTAGGNDHPFLATMATFAYTALVVHPLWITLIITGAAWALGQIWPSIYTDTRIASRENLILHAIVIGFWLGIGLIVATSKLARRLLTGHPGAPAPDRKGS